MTIRVGINGFSKIGRLIFYNSQYRKNIKVVVINDLIDINDVIRLLKVDFINDKKFNNSIKIIDNNLFINNNKIYFTSYSKPNDIKWSKFNVDIVIESTGLFLTKNLSYGHILSGAKYVIMTSLPNDDTPIFVMGINNHNYNGQNIISNASPIINCLAPIVKVINDNFEITESFITNIYSSIYNKKITSNHSLKNLYTYKSIVPVFDKSINFLNYIIPDLKNKIIGMSLKISFLNISLIDFTAKLNSNVTYDEICSCMEEASKTYLRGILGVIYDNNLIFNNLYNKKLVSIFDAKSVLILNNNFIKFISWYNNEIAYSEKILDLLSYIYYYN